MSENLKGPKKGTPLSAEDLGRLIAEDKKLAAFHEAGHAVVALACGVEWVLPWIERVEGRNLKTESAFTGKCQRGEACGKVNTAAIGYAGVAAEEIARCYNKDEGSEISALDIFEWVDMQILAPSVTDLESIQTVKGAWRMRACRKCIEILTAHWDVVSGIAHEIQRDYAVDCVYFAGDLKRQVWRGQLAPTTLKPNKEPAARSGELDPRD